MWVLGLVCIVYIKILFKLVEIGFIFGLSLGGKVFLIVFSLVLIRLCVK